MKRSGGNDVFDNSPFRRYMRFEGDDEVRFAKQPNGTYKFWKLSMKKQDDGKVLLINYHGDVGTDGVEEVEGEYAHFGHAARKMGALKAAKFLSDKEEDQYHSYSEMQRMKEKEEEQERKKAKKENTVFPTIYGKLVYPPSGSKSKSRTNWVPILQEFMSTYEYVQDEHRRYDTSSTDPSEWTFYQAVDSNDASKSAKKAHSALVKKSPFVKELSKEYPGKIIEVAYNSHIYYKIFELRIDEVAYYLLTVCLCDNDDMGHYNVLYNSRKKEMFRIEVLDTPDATADEDGEWVTAAMKKKNQDLINRIELFMLSRDMLQMEGAFVFDWENETCTAEKA